MNENNFDPLRYVFTSPVQCPLCGATSLKSKRSALQADGSRRRPTRCRTCSHDFFAIVEAPEPNLGNLEFAVGKFPA
jgi:hypothetical protein